MRTIALKKSDVITLSIASALALAALTANILLGISPLTIVLPLIGAAACGVLSFLGRFDVRITCDYIQSGEAAVGSLALFAVLTLSGDRIVVTGALFAAILLYDAYLAAALAPDKKEHAINGALVLAAAAVIIVFLAAGGPGGTIAALESSLIGRLPVEWRDPAVPAAAGAAVMILFAVVRLAGPELRMSSSGPAFFAGPAFARAAIQVFAVAARGILVSTAILFAGVTCGIGISAARINRGALPVTVAAIACAALAQISVMIAKLAGPWYAAGLSFIVSYILFAVYYTKRKQLYDRHQKP